MLRSCVPGLVTLATMISAGPGCRGGSQPEPSPAPAPSPAQTPIDALPPTLQLVQLPASRADEVQVELQYHPQPLAPRPRSMELYLRPSSNLTLVSASGGTAAMAAAKTLSTEPAAGGQVRTLLSSDNIVTLEAGAIAEYRFHRSAPGVASIALLNEKPVFSPPPANAGLILGEPLQSP
jgi:hypothetical protein